MSCHKFRREFIFRICLDAIWIHMNSGYQSQYLQTGSSDIIMFILCACTLRLRSCLFCEGRISVLKRWFKTPIQNADSKRRSKTPLIQAIVRAQVNRKGVYMTSFKRGYNVILRSCFHQNQRFALTTIVNAHFWAAFMLILRRRFETLIQNADPKRRSRKYCSCFPREEDDTFTEEGMSRNSRMFNSGYCSSSSEPERRLYDVI